ncbi:integrating conjugative element protein (plasmid) [Microbulbifer sp. TRSA002]|uniref:integrating conjugative element protein n=1 Tax=Microbulbifer sp. TRSA002 TaxID=3243382 RepID=UPI004039B8E2
MINIKTRLVAIAATIALSNVVLADSREHSPRLKGATEYQIGGGYFSDAPTRVQTVPVLELGVGWDMNMECGEFDPRISVSNQLNGITEGFRDMMDNIIQSATGAVASLPALAIQRANPGLYDLLQQGILQGKMDFEWAETSCEEMSRVLMGEQSFPFEKYKLSIKTNNWANEINASGGDAIRAKKALDDTNHGNGGAEWACGVLKGGTGQQPIRALSDVVQVGYNIMFDRVNSCATSTVGTADGQGTPLWEYWNGPVTASNWSTRVLGDIEVRTCDGCKKMHGTPGKGLTYMHRDMTDVLMDDLEDLVTGATQLTWQNLNRVSAPPGVIINDTIIMAIRKRDSLGQGEMIRKLAGEIAYARLVEQGRLLTQLLRTGVKEPNIAAFEPAKLVVNDSIDQLQVELDQLDHEIKTRQAIAKETIVKIMGLEEKRIQETIIHDRAKATGTNQLGTP